MDFELGRRTSVEEVLPILTRHTKDGVPDWGPREHNLQYYGQFLRWRSLLFWGSTCLLDLWPTG